MNILLILPPSFADVVCSTALVRCLKKQVANANLHVLVPAAYQYLLAANPYIDQLLPAQSLHTTIAAGKYNVLIDAAELEENRRWAKGAGVKYLGEAGASFWSTIKEIFGTASKEHRALQFLDLAHPLGVRYDGAGLDVFLPQNAVVPQHDIPTSHSAGYVVLAFGHTLPVSTEVLELFCRQIDFPLMVTGSAGFFETAHQLAGVDAVKVYNACGKFSEGEIADLLRRARLVVSADEGALQVAAAFGRPAIILQTAHQATDYLPPLYAQHLLQVGKQPYTLMAVPKGARLTYASGKNEKPHNDAAPFAAKLVAGVKEML